MNSDFNYDGVTKQERADCQPDPSVVWDEQLAETACRRFTETIKEPTNVQTEQDQEAFTAAVAPGKTETVTELAARRIVVTLNRKQRRAVQAERRTGLSLVAALKKLNLLKLTA